MRIQTSLKDYLTARINWTKYVHGGIKKRSIFTNALPHIGKEIVANLDIAGFFPNVNEMLVHNLFLRAGCTDITAEMLMRLTTLNNGLPQGSPTSTILGNLVLEPLDSRFMEISRKYGFSYTRFIDDLTISGSVNLMSFKGEFFHLIRSHGFDIAQDKVNFWTRNQQQLVTKLIVNDKLRPSHEFIREVKRMIRASWPENSGPLLVALENNMTTIKQFKAMLNGKISFIQSADNKIGQQLYSLLSKINWKQPYSLSLLN